MNQELTPPAFFPIGTPPIVRSTGETESEKYLARLCERTFLSLWSYPNLYTPEGRRNGRGVGKELCDLLVVFGNHVVIFSDKNIHFNEEAPLNVAWGRWKKRSIDESARQLWGAEKWIREHSHKIFLDPECTLEFPLHFDGPARIHLVAVTRNSARHARRHFTGSSGTLVLRPNHTLEESTIEPFVVSDLDAAKTYIHVLDEDAIEAIFSELDTAYDFLRYLTAKEAFLRSGRVVSVDGEEELLAVYILNGGTVEEDAFAGLLRNADSVPGKAKIIISEGWWKDYLLSVAKLDLESANQVSYFWDGLIEHFSQYIRSGTALSNVSTKVIEHEKAIRFLAREGRVARRLLSEAFLRKIMSFASGKRSGQISVSPFNPDTCFVLLLYVRDEGENYESYRLDRSEVMLQYGIVAKYRFPEVSNIVVIGTEPLSGGESSQDVTLLEIDKLSDEEMDLAKLLVTEHNILRSVSLRKETSFLAPLPGERPRRSKIERTRVKSTSPCPCGSGKAYRRCHGR